jgi:chondroitin 4-sulfotransferase 11
MISHNYRCIFIHIQKTGGTSIEQALNGNPVWDHDDKPLIIEKYGQTTWDKYFKFTFVRNPWDRLVSRYFWRWRLYKGVKECADVTYFENFHDWAVNFGFSLDLQTPWIYENGNNVLDFVGKLETINTDFKYVCEKIGATLKLGHIKKTNHFHYSWYYNEELEKLGENIFYQDIKNFNYKFERVPKPSHVQLREVKLF